MDIDKLKVTIPQKDFATSSDDYLAGFEAGVRAAIDAFKSQALDGLPSISKEEGLKMRTGQATPSQS